MEKQIEIRITKDLYQVGDRPGALTIPAWIREQWGYPTAVDIIPMGDHIEIWPHKNGDSLTDNQAA